MPLSRASTAAILLLTLISANPLAQSIRDRIRLNKDLQTPITEAQANELTLTHIAAAVRPIQVWVRTAGAIEPTGRTITARLLPMDVGHVKVGQRVRAFPPESRSSMFQARVTKVDVLGKTASVTVRLSGPAHQGSSRYILEIVTEPLEVLSVSNEAIIEAVGKHVVYVQIEKGRYVAREIELGLQGELYTQVLNGLKAGEEVVTFGSFFIDADQKLKGS